MSDQNTTTTGAIERRLLELAKEQREQADAGGIPNHIEAARAAQAAYEAAADIVHSAAEQDQPALSLGRDVIKRLEAVANRSTLADDTFLRDLAKNLGDRGQGAKDWPEEGRDQRDQVWLDALEAKGLVNGEEVEADPVEVAEALAAFLARERGPILQALLDLERVNQDHFHGGEQERQQQIADAIGDARASLSASSDTGGAGERNSPVWARMSMACATNRHDQCDGRGKDGFAPCTCSCHPDCNGTGKQGAGSRR